MFTQIYIKIVPEILKLPGVIYYIIWSGMFEEEEMFHQTLL